MEDAARHLARDLLEWYRAVGVTDAVADTATDWLARGAVPPGRQAQAALAQVTETHGSAPARSPGAPAHDRVLPLRRAPEVAPAAEPVRQFATAAPDEAVMQAREQARAATSLAELEATLNAFNGCTLKATAKHLCFYRGAQAARVMLIGEAPGRDEDLEGKPFVGRSGQLLDRMLAAIGLDESSVHVTNVVYWRPPGNRTPTPLETQVCRPFLERQIELVGPEIVVLLGGAAAKQVLGVEDGIMRLRGKWREIEIGGTTRRTLATLHPAFLLRTPAQKRLAWRDFVAVAMALEGKGG